MATAVAAHDLTKLWRFQTRPACTGIESTRSPHDFVEAADEVDR
ncbi:MAG: hypothetical protein V9G12_07905 [Microthrixaceae bacterium]